MEEIIKLVINWAIPVILTGILVFMKKMINDMKAMKLSQLSLIRSQIVSVSENDILYLFASSSADKNVSGQMSYMTVEVVE